MRDGDNVQSVQLQKEEAFALQLAIISGREEEMKEHILYILLRIKLKYFHEK